MVDICKIFLKYTIEEGAEDIKFFKEPIVGNHKIKDEMGGSRFNKWAKSLGKIKSFLLIIALCNETRFVPFNGVIGIAFYFEDPATTNNIHVYGGRNK